MALGIVRAADQGAIWREADYDGLSGESSTSGSPSGAGTPDGVTIPNSNKFKTPTNGLKKLLDAIPADSPPGGPGHTKLIEWLAAHESYTKPYFKPNYAPAIEHSVGKENYQKLQKYAPTVLQKALSTHTQQPAPNSNKFKTPANGLKKLLENPNSTAEHLNEWLGTNQGSAFAKTYLNNPEYQDAIKGHLGAGAMSKLKNMQGAPVQAQPSQKSKEEQVADSAAKAFAPAGFKPQTQEQALATPANPAPTPSYDPGVNSPHYDNLKEQVHPNSPMGGQMKDPAYHEWFHSHTKADQAELAGNPGIAYQKFNKWKAKHPNAGQGKPKATPDDHSSDIDAIKSEMGGTSAPGAPPPGASGPSEIVPPAVPDGPPEAKKQFKQHVAIPAAIQKFFPGAKVWSDGKEKDISEASDDEIKAQLETWLKYLPEHKGYSEHVPKIQAVYDKFFGAGGLAPDAPPAATPAEEEQWPEPGGTIDLTDDDKPKSSGWGDKAKQAFPTLTPGSVQVLNKMSEPEAKQLLTGIVEGNAWGDEATKNLKAMGIGVEDDSNDWEQQLLAQPDPTPKAQTFGEMAHDAYPMAFSEEKAKKFDEWEPEKQESYLKGWINSADDPAIKAKLQAFYDKNFGGDAGNTFEDKYPTQGNTSFKDWLHNHSWALNQLDADDLHKLYDKYSAGNDVGADSGGYDLQDLFDADDQLNEGQFYDLFNKPSFKLWWYKQDKDAQSYYVNDPSEAVKTFNMDDDGEDDDGEDDDGEEYHSVYADTPGLQELANSYQDKEFASNDGGGDDPPEFASPEFKKWWKILSADSKAYYTEYPHDALSAFKKQKGGMFSYMPTTDELMQLSASGAITGSTYQVLLSKPESWWKEHFQDLENQGGPTPSTSETWKQLWELHQKHKEKDGGGTPAPGGGELDGTMPFDFDVNDFIDQAAVEYSGIIKSQTPQKFLDNLKYVKGKYDEDKYQADGSFGDTAWPKLIEAYEKQYGPISSSTVMGQTNAKPVEPPGKNAWAHDQVVKEYSDIFGIDPEQAVIGGKNYDDMGKELHAKYEDFLNYGDGHDNDNNSTTSKLKALWDKYWGPGQTSDPSANFDPSAAAKEYGAIHGLTGDINAGGKKYKSLSYDEFKKKVADNLAKAKEGEAPYSNWSSTKLQKVQAFYDKYFGDGAASGGWDWNNSGAPAGPPPFDWGKFGPEFKNLFPGSSWATGEDPGPEGAEAKLKSAVDAAESNFPGTEKTEKAKALYKKYFGDGVPPAKGAPPPEPSTGAENLKTVIPQVSDSGEDPSAVSSLYKTEDLNPVDLANWAKKKPETAQEWKDFAEWWGKTKTAPEQDALLYGEWFPGKHPSNDMAQAWMSQVFAYHSKPGGGDLSLEQPPSWAHTKWAFGDDAEAEWPVFAKWAASDPGIPKGLGVKQKLQIWKSLSKGDKDEIKGNYMPENPVDANAVVSALKKAYPDSNWAAWEKMPQGTLKNSMEVLAKNGYAGAIPIWNSVYGGNVPMPEAKTEEEAAAPEPIKIVPVSQLPDWVGQAWDTSHNSAVKFTKLKHIGDAVGMGQLVNDGNVNAYSNYQKAPSEVVNLVNEIPEYLQDQLMETPANALPFHSPEQLKQWVSAQPKPKDDMEAIYPGFYDGLSSYGQAKWDNFTGYSATQKQQIENKIDYETDPLKKQQLLDVYYKYFGGNKPTAAQALKEVYPQGIGSGKGAIKDWDQFLKTNDKEAIEKTIKKLFKTETDPEKFVALVDVWGKYFNGNTGVKQLTNVLKGHSTGYPVDATTLTSLLHWKKVNGGEPSVPLKDWWALKSWDHESPYLKKIAEDNGGTVLPFKGWTPPGHKGGGFVADPAMLGGSTPKYEAPAPEHLGVELTKLLDTVKEKKHLYGAGDVAVAGSEDFQNWFASTPTAYRKSFQYNPGVAIDDFKEWQNGGHMGEVPEDDGQAKVYDVSPFGLLNKEKSKVHLKQKYGPAFKPADEVGSNQNTQSEFDYDPFSYNPQRGDNIKFPRAKDEQETLPLGGGSQWAPQYKGMPIYRVMRLNLTKPDNYNKNPEREKLRKQIIDIIRGQKPSDNPEQPTLFDDVKGQTWPKEAPPIPKTPDQWMGVLEWAKKNGVTGEQMYDLAEKAGATPGKFGQPPLANQAGNWEDPRLAPLLLKYIEADTGKSPGGIGVHWTRSRKKAYDGIPSAGHGATTNDPTIDDIPIMFSGVWGGQGEATNGIDGSYQVYSGDELEHALVPKAPFLLRRMQLRAPGGDWHDTIDYGPMAHWDEGRDEQTKDKPSLAKRLGDDLGDSFSSSVYDDLKPGPKADKLFNDLVQKYPDQKDKIKKIYEHYFVGRPDLKTKPHIRQAAMSEFDTETIEARIASLVEADWDPSSGTVDPAKMWNNFGELSLGHGAEIGSHGETHRPPAKATPKKPEIKPGESLSDYYRRTGAADPIRTMEANIERICREADRKSESWLYERIAALEES